MSRFIWAPVEGKTLADMRSLLRWFRSKRGPLYIQWQSGGYSLEDGDLTFRRLLRILDGPEAGVRAIEVFGAASSIAEDRALFSAYRRLRRAEQRLNDEVRRQERAARQVYVTSTAPAAGGGGVCTHDIEAIAFVRGEP